MALRQVLDPELTHHLGYPGFNPGHISAAHKRTCSPSVPTTAPELRTSIVTVIKKQHTSYWTDRLPLIPGVFFFFNRIDATHISAML